MPGDSRQRSLGHLMACRGGRPLARRLQDRRYGAGQIMLLDAARGDHFGARSAIRIHHHQPTQFSRPHPPHTPPFSSALPPAAPAGGSRVGDSTRTLNGPPTRQWLPPRQQCGRSAERCPAPAGSSKAAPCGAAPAAPWSRPQARQGLPRRPCPAATSGKSTGCGSGAARCPCRRRQPRLPRLRPRSPPTTVPR